MKHIRTQFITGLFVVLPIGLTLWIISKAFNMLDSIIGSTLYQVIGMRIPGLGLVIILALIYAIGGITSNFMGKKLHDYLERLFENLPIIKTIYIPIKDILKNFANDKSNNFKKAVLVTYPMEGSHSIGFITKEKVEFDGEVLTAIFIPTTPNPTSGFLVYMKPNKYTELDISVEVALKSIISLGSVSPNVIMARSKAVQTKS